jgi:hypothetical protein
MQSDDIRWLARCGKLSETRHARASACAEMCVLYCAIALFDTISTDQFLRRSFHVETVISL